MHDLLLIEQEVISGGGLSPAQAAKRFPSVKAVGAVNPATVWRWIVKGVRLSNGCRVKLEALRMGAGYLTSEPALLRFLRAQQPDAAPPPMPRTAKQRSKAA